jgi:hypothetical protein
MMMATIEWRRKAEEDDGGEEDGEGKRRRRSGKDWFVGGEEEIKTKSVVTGPETRSSLVGE